MPDDHCGAILRLRLFQNCTCCLVRFGWESSRQKVRSLNNPHRDSFGSPKNVFCQVPARNFPKPGMGFVPKNDRVALLRLPVLKYSAGGIARLCGTREFMKNITRRDTSLPQYLNCPLDGRLCGFARRFDPFLLITPQFVI